ncbi:MAG: PAS domain-containing sensor histidine kinase, partial [Gemmatimonadota bacterium]
FDVRRREAFSMSRATQTEAGPKGESRGPVRRRAATAPGIALVYLLFGLIWIVASSYVGPRLRPDAVTLRNYEIIKGAVFVLLSTGLVFVLARGADRARIRQARRAGRFQSLVDRAPDMVFWLASRDGSEFVYVSPAVEEMFGLSRSEVYDHPAVLWDRLEPEDDVPAPTSPESFLEEGECRAVRPDGGEEWIAAQAYPVREVEEGQDLVAGVFVGITERARALETVRQREHLLRRAQQVGRLGYWTLDRRTGGITWSDEVYRIFGRRPEVFEPTRESFIDCVHPEDRAAQESADRALLQGLAPLDIRHRIIRPDGEVRYVHERASLSDMSTDQVLGTVQDVTSQVRLERELERSRDLVREWAAREVTARERERLEIAREIHDDLGQLLTAIRMRLEREVPEEGDGERHRRNLEIVDAALDSVRALASRLRPPTLDQLGLLGAIEEHARWFDESTGITTRIVSDVEEVPLDAEASVHLFRIVQEALTNVARHADAEHAGVEVRRAKDEMTLTIFDDGVGLAASDGADARGHGVVGMRERAIALGGTLELGANEPEGTRVTVRIPTTERRPT